MSDESDSKTKVNAGVEGFGSLLGCVVFFNTGFDFIANKISTFAPVALNTSLPGLIFSGVSSFFGGLGAYKCHEEVGRANQPLDDHLEELVSGAADAEIEAEAKENNDESTDDRILRQKNLDELIDTIKELRLLLKEKDAKLKKNSALLAQIAKEKEAAKTTPLSNYQKWYVLWEYINHGAGFVGVIQLLFTWIKVAPPEVEIPVEIACLFIALYGAIAEARTATTAMRFNNARDKLSKQHGLFKPQTGETAQGNLEIRIDDLSIASTDSNSSDYQKLDSEVTYHRPLSPASSLSHATL